MNKVFGIFSVSKTFSEPNCPPKLLLISEEVEVETGESVPTIILVNEILPIGHPNATICDPRDCNSGCFNGCMCQCKKTISVTP